MNMRPITTHHTNEANKRITIAADDRGQGNMSHVYRIGIAGETCGEVEHIRFQNGPIKEVGVNGLTNEALLAIVIDRLEGAQAGPYACDENGDALSYLKNALERLEARTKAREARGVEGTHKV
jgi:hypothetical protein